MEKVLVLIEAGLNAREIMHKLTREIAMSGNIPILGTVLTNSGAHSLVNGYPAYQHIWYKPISDENPPTPGTEGISVEAITAAIELCDKVVYGYSGTVKNMGLPSDPIMAYVDTAKSYDKPVELWCYGSSNEDPPGIHFKFKREY